MVPKLRKLFLVTHPCVLEKLIISDIVIPISDHQWDILWAESHRIQPVIYLGRSITWKTADLRGSFIDRIRLSQITRDHEKTNIFILM